MRTYWGREFKAELGLRLTRQKAAEAASKSMEPASLASRFVARNKYLESLARRMSAGFTSDIIRSGVPVSPLILSRQFVFYTIVGLLICVPISLVLFLSVSPIALSVLIIPVFLLFGPRFKVMMAVGDRKRAADDELPFFTTYASIMQMVGISMFDSFRKIIGRGVFKQLERDAKLIYRNALFFVKDPISALESTGRTHPNEKVRTLLLGYTSEWRSGGDMANYLVTKAHDMLADMEFRWKKYANQTTEIGEMMVSLFFVMPVLVLTSAFLLPSGTVNTLSVVTLVGIPVITVVAFMMIQQTQPKTYDIVKGNWRLAIIAGIAAFIVTLGLRQLFISIGTAIIAATTVYGFGVTAQLREISSIEKALPNFIRDITEYRKMGYDIRKAVIKIARENTYGPAFDKYLKAVGKQLEVGLRMSEIRVPIRSWLANMTFFLLGQIMDTGGGSPAALENLSNFVNNVQRVKSETKSMMRLYDVLTYITPLGLGFSLSLMTNLISSFSTAFSFNPSSALAGASPLGSGALGTINPETVLITNVLIVVCSLCIAFLASKSIDFTAKSTIRIAVNVAIALIAITAMGSVVSLLLPKVQTPSG
jgi:flagellar protein FlaJ